MTDNKNKTPAHRTPVHRFPINIRNHLHFTAIISALNTSCKSGMENWTMTKKVSKYLRRQQNPVTTEVLIFNESINTVELETFIKLL